MIILTEKPSVAKDFASALGCSYSAKDKCYKSSDGKTTIANCVGHLFILAEPAAYNPSFKSWKNLPVIPEKFIYIPSENLKDVAKNVVSLLKQHKTDEILIATDADREGEIIARECLNAAGITDYDNIRRFWVSQALTKDVILDGIKNARPISDYDFLAKQGFARQKADWLIGMNATRYVSNRVNGGGVLAVGRVQTAILSEIARRCKEISSFKREKYYEAEAALLAPDDTSYVTATFEKDGSTHFSDKSTVQKLDSLENKTAKLVFVKHDKRTVNPPQLYNLNDLQKDAFAYFGYSAEMTLSVVQRLYENYKCVSYPRTPSRVMGSHNVELCRELFDKMLRASPEYFELHSVAEINESNKRIFDDSKLEAHHALIPLSTLPENATVEDDNIYSLILERFMLAFAPACEMENMTVHLSVNENIFVTRGTKVINAGWKDYRRFTRNLGNRNEISDAQDLSEIELENLTVKSIEVKEKFTKPPKHYNEASLLAFMENPKNSDNQKLAGLGTSATRHTFIPKLIRNKFITAENKNLLVTKQGERLLEVLSKTPFKNIADVSETTRWEEELSENPDSFLEEIKSYIKDAVSEGAA